MNSIEVNCAREIPPDDFEIIRVAIAKAGTGIKKRVISERTFKAGYVVRRELWFHYSDIRGTEMRSAYNLNGEYIGDPKFAKRLIIDRGIMPELASKNHSVCSIGFCEKENKWYGWSHRAICGFGIGDKLFEERFLKSDTTPFIKAGKKTIRDMNDAKQAAKNFAGYVS